MTPRAAAEIAQQTLAQMGVQSTVLRVSEHQVLLAVAGADILQRLGEGIEGLKPGIPVYVDRLPIRYQLETGRVLGPHPS